MPMPVFLCIVITALINKTGFFSFNDAAIIDMWIIIALLTSVVLCTASDLCAGENLVLVNCIRDQSTGRTDVTVSGQSVHPHRCRDVLLQLYECGYDIASSGFAMHDTTLIGVYTLVKPRQRSVVESFTLPRP